MTTQYPAKIDNIITLPDVIDNVTPIKGEVVNRLRDAILAIEKELGIKPSTVYGTVRARLDAIENAIINEGGNTIFGGDLSGVNGNQTVVGIQTIPIVSTTPTAGQILTFIDSTWSPQDPFSVGGDLSGNNTSQTVIGIRGVSVSATSPNNGAIITYSGNNVEWEPQIPLIPFDNNRALRSSENAGSRTNIFNTGVALTPAIKDFGGSYGCLDTTTLGDILFYTGPLDGASSTDSNLYAMDLNTNTSILLTTFTNDYVVSMCALRFDNTSYIFNQTTGFVELGRVDYIDNFPVIDGSNPQYTEQYNVPVTSSQFGGRSAAWKKQYFIFTDGTANVYAIDYSGNLTTLDTGSNPIGIVIDDDGFIYISYYGSKIIKKYSFNPITPSMTLVLSVNTSGNIGELTTDGKYLFGFDRITGTLWQFNSSLMIELQSVLLENADTFSRIKCDGTSIWITMHDAGVARVNSETMEELVLFYDLFIPFVISSSPESRAIAITNAREVLVFWSNNGTETINMSTLTGEPHSANIYSIRKLLRPLSISNGGRRSNTVSVNHVDSPYNINTTTSPDTYIFCNSGAGVITVNLPTAPNVEDFYIIKDSAGTAATHNITITATGGFTINGSSTLLINSNYQSYTLIFDTFSNWSII